MSNSDIFNHSPNSANNESIETNRNSADADGFNKYKSYFYGSPFAAASFSKSGFIIDFNENFSRLFDVDDITILSFNLFNIEDRFQTEAVKSVLNGENTHYEGFYKSITTGRSIPINAALSPVFKNNEVIGGIIVIEDTSFRKQLERLFFHDLLNNCGNIRNLTEILIDSKIDDDLRNKINYQVNAQANRMLDEIKIYRHLLSFGRTDLKAGYRELHSIDFLGDCLTRFASPDQLMGQIAEIDETCADFTFLSDPLLLYKILEYMIKNALAATQAGGIITLCSQMTNGTICFSIKNPGFIPEIIQPLIFTRHYYKKDNEKGIGTYCLKYLAENYLNGEVSFTTDRENGTKFFLKFSV